MTTMKLVLHHLTRLSTALPPRWLLALLVLCAIAAGLTRAQSTTVVIPTVALASEPLYAGGLRVKPTLTLALSVEFPTVGAAYLNATYDDVSTEYVGYYDSKGCYTYDKTNKYFARSGAAGTSHDCSGTGFSGNFMNWATSSAIDILRYALTGGDRIVDVSGQTVLQRAILPDGSISSVPTFYNTGNFPSKQITAAQAARALPSTMLSTVSATTLATTGVVVANCLNQIYFGTVVDGKGSCAAAGGNGILGTSTSITAMNTALPTATYNSTACANESNTLCTFPTNGTYAVAFGAGSRYNVGYFTGSVSCSNTVFGDPAVGVAKSCYVAKVATATPSAFLSSDPYFLARVQVCDSGDAAVRTDLCLQYPSGSFKPVGNLQKYSDRIRVAVFGYLMDQTTNRYGGVLRAPMKYVGSKTYDNNFTLVSGANPLQEWDSTTGVLLANPNSDSMGVSGAINYLNHFGRTSTLGLYKRYDPVSELYYETVRYLQGLQPTNDSSTDSRYSAISGLTSSATDPLKDGFPVYTSWSDPLPAVNGLSNYACIANSILTVGDVNTHYDRYIPGNSSAPGGDPVRAVRADYNEPDFFTWTKVVGAFESNHTPVVTYLDNAGTSRNAFNPMTANTSLWGLETKIPGDQNGYFMAGIAYWAKTHDIRPTGLANYSATTLARPGMRVTSYFIDVNENGSDSVGQTNHTTNPFYLAAKYGGFTDASNFGNPFLASPTDTTGTNTNWANSTAPNDPKTYFLGSNGADLIAALNNVFAAAVQQAGSIAGGSLSSQTQASSATYQAKFDPTDWSGDLVDYPVTATTTSLTVGTDNTATWRASTTASTSGTLDTLAAASRNIYIGRSVADATNGAATAFNWSSTSLEQTTRDALQTPPYSSATSPTDPASTGQARLNYLRGDSTNEAPNGLLFRKRLHKLGDIVNSGVVYKGAPDSTITDSGYSTFYSSNASRTPVVYVGANDGMLHAFNATSGAELFAYIPSMVIPKLAGLTSSNYVHTSFVDATPVVAEAYVSTTTPAWKTVLVSGLGAGGQGVFALDVTSPTTFGASNVMWEFKDTDDADMGNVIGRPQIVKVRTSAPTATTATYKWFAAVASGVNNNSSDGNASDGAPALFLLDLAKQPGSSWVNGTNYFKIKFPAAADLTKANGVVGFTPYPGDANEVSVLYAGDLQGNLWKLDFSKANFSSSSSSGWSLSTLSAYHDTTNTTVPVPLFIATDTAVASTAKTQPISVEPALFSGPNHGLVVVFGTGRFLEASDVSATPFGIQSIYAVYDDGSGPIGSSSSPGRASLMSGTLSASTNTVPSFNYGRPTSANASASPPIKEGWVSNLPAATSLGERIVSSPQALQNSLVALNSIQPPLNGCATGGSNLYLVNPLTGSGTNTAFTDLSAASQFVMLGSSVSSRDNSGSGWTTTTWQSINQTATSGPQAGQKFDTYLPYGRLSWRQILNN